MQATLVREVRPDMLALTSGAIFLLLIAGANVANLLFVCALPRGAELAVRAALGAGRTRIVRQMVAEAVVRMSFGAVAGVAIAWFGVRQVLAVAPANLPRLDVVTPQCVAAFDVRMAIGASPAQILRLVIGHGLGLSAGGIVLGVAAALFLIRGMTTMLVGVRPDRSGDLRRHGPAVLRYRGRCRRGCPRAGPRHWIRQRGCAKGDRQCKSWFFRV